MSILDDLACKNHRTLGKKDDEVPESAKPGLTDVAIGQKALALFVERTRDGTIKDQPVKCDGEVVGGFASLITLENRVMMQGCTIGMNDVKNFVVSLLSLLYGQMKEQEFYAFMFELPRHVVKADGTTNVHHNVEMEETKQ